MTWTVRCQSGATGTRKEELDRLLRAERPYVAAIAMDPTLVTLEESHVAIETGDGPAQGMSVSHHKPFQRAIFRRTGVNARVALAVDADRFHRLFRERVLDWVRDRV